MAAFIDIEGGKLLFAFCFNYSFYSILLQFEWFSNIYIYIYIYIKEIYIYALLIKVVCDFLICDGSYDVRWWWMACSLIRHHETWAAWFDSLSFLSLNYVGVVGRMFSSPKQCCLMMPSSTIRLVLFIITISWSSENHSFVSQLRWRHSGNNATKKRREANGDHKRDSWCFTSR